jgi:hypothetical protein
MDIVFMDIYNKLYTSQYLSVCTVNLQLSNFYLWIVVTMWSGLRVAMTINLFHSPFDGLHFQMVRKANSRFRI